MHLELILRFVALQRDNPLYYEEVKLPIALDIIEVRNPSSTDIDSSLDIRGRMGWNFFDGSHTSDLSGYMQIVL